MRHVGYAGVLAFLVLASVANGLTEAEFKKYIDEINAAARQNKQTIPVTTKSPSPPLGASSPLPASYSGVISYNDSCPVLPRALSRGSRGTDVTALQKFLIGANLLSGD